METTIVPASFGWMTVGIMYLLLMLRDYNARELADARQYAELSAEQMFGFWFVDRVSIDGLASDVFLYLSKGEKRRVVEVLWKHPDIEGLRLLKPGSEIEICKDKYPELGLEYVACGHLQFGLPD